MLDHEGHALLGKEPRFKMPDETIKDWPDVTLRRVGSRRLSTTQTYIYILYIYIYTVYIYMDGYGLCVPSDSTLFPSICKLLAAFLRSSLVFARFLQRF